MLYFLHGTDTGKARDKARELVSVLLGKKPDAEVFKIDGDSWSVARFEEFSGAQGLFERKFIVFGNRVLENKEAKEVVLEKISALAKSDNVFIFLEGKVDKASLAAITKVAEKVQAFDKESLKEKEVFNMFALADAFGQRDRKSLWVLYQKALRGDASGEELVGILFWQIKSILAAREAQNASEAGLSPFVFQKAKRYGRNFKSRDAENFAEGLIKLYHDSHRGFSDMENSLERFVLSV